MPAIPAAAVHLPIDWITLGLFAAVVAIYSTRGGPQLAVSFSLAAPLALYLNVLLVSSAYLGVHIAALSAPWRLALFAGLFLSLLIIVYFMFPAKLHTGSYPIQALMSGLAAACVLAVVWLQIPELQAYMSVSALAAKIFGAPYRFYWLLCAYIALAVARE